jgi:hypothetical protein
MITSMRRELAELREQTRLIPVRWGNPLTVDVITSCSGSDVLITVVSTQFTGVALPGTVPTVLPQVDPTSLWTFPAFLGKGLLRGAYVWIATKVNPGTGNVSDTLAAIPNGQSFMTRRSVVMPVTGGGTASVYLPWQF